MKNILKKIGVIGLTIAVLAPFIEIPRARAATANCTSHIQSYFFLDNSNPRSYNGNGYTTFTTFPFIFPKTTGTEVEVTKAYINNFKSANTNLLTKFYSDVMNLESSRFNRYDNASNMGNFYVDSTVDTSTYGSNTLLLHGVWARLDEYGQSITNDWSTVNTTGVDKTIQRTVLNNYLNVYISGARYSGYNDRFSQLTNYADSEVNGALGINNNMTNNAIVNYLNFIINNFEEANNRDYVFPSGTEGEYNFNLQINRLFNANLASANKNFVVKPSNATSDADICVYSSSSSTIADSYAKYVESGGDLKCGVNNDTDCCFKNLYTETVKNSTDTVMVQPYYWPVVLNVEYKVCTVANTNYWSLEYNANTTETYKNLPDPVENIALTDKQTVANGPERDGYSFKKWCIDPKGEYGCYNPGDQIGSDEAKRITLYAQWGDASEGQQNKYGITSYIIGFIAVGTISIGIYMVSKKKNLFKQI